MEESLVESYKDLHVWQRAIQLSTAVYKLTAGFPSEERFGLTAQMRRSSVSIASNIAEGYGRLSRGEYKHFLGVARGSNSELQTQMVIATNLGFGHPDGMTAANRLSDEVARMLVGLIQKL